MAREYVWLECTETGLRELSCSEGNSGDGTAAVDEVLPEVEAAYTSQGVSQEIKEGCWWRNLFGDVNLLGV